MTNANLVPTLPATYQFFGGERGLDYFIGKWNIKWQSWSWCNLDELIALINRTYRKSWDRREIMERFCFEHQEVRATSNKKHVPPMGFYIVDKNGGQFAPFRRQEASMVFYCSNAKQVFVPAGWAKDVLWALYSECPRFRILPGHGDEKVLSACWEDGEGVYIV